MKPIHKFNGGIGATLCHTCSVIISTGLTKDLYCNNCKLKQERSYSEEEVLDILYRFHYDLVNSNLDTKEEWFEQFKKK